MFDTGSFHFFKPAVCEKDKIVTFANAISKAQMAELVDALVSGTSISNYVQVRVLFWALQEAATNSESDRKNIK